MPRTTHLGKRADVQNVSNSFAGEARGLDLNYRNNDLGQPNWTPGPFPSIRPGGPGR